MSRLSLILHGGRGRMGRAIAEVAEPHDDALVRAVVGRGDPFPASAPERSVVVDFSTPSAVPGAASWAAEHGVPLVCGTTGLDAAADTALDEASRLVPVLYARNTSLGVAILTELVERAAAALPPEFAAEIVELHHDRKADAPSGTALHLFEALRGARADAVAVHGREGTPGPRPLAEVGVFALRGGTVAGEHTVHFLGPDERLELTHRAGDRSIFARGALAAARWLVERPPGRYAMRDVLGGR